MNKIVTLQRNILAFGIPFSIIIVMILITKSPVFYANTSSLSTLITFDLLITMPIVYLLIIRKTTIPKKTVLPLLIIGSVIGSLILPPENQNYLNLFKTWALPILELSILLFVIAKVINTLKNIKRTKQNRLIFLRL